MKKKNLTDLGLTPLSDTEITAIDGGFPWPDLRSITKAVVFVAMYMITEPINELAKGISKGLDASMKK